LLLVDVLKYFIYYHFIQNERVFATVGGQFTAKLEHIDKLTNVSQLCEVYNTAVDNFEDVKTYFDENNIEWSGYEFKITNPFGI